MALLGAGYFPVIRREPSLAVYYRLNEAVGAIIALDFAAKYTLNGFYAGSVQGGPLIIEGDASAGSGVFASAGTNVQVGDASALRILADLALEAWVIPTTASQNAVLIGKGTSGFKSNPYSLSLVNGAPSLAVGNGSTQTAITSAAALLVGAPSHVVGTIFRGAMTLYVNGTLVASGTVGAQAVTDGGQPLYIGCGQQSSSFLTGLLAEAAVYSGGLSVARIKRHYAIGAQLLPDDAHYSTVDPPVFS